jgi:hypothetical protein
MKLVLVVIFSGLFTFPSVFSNSQEERRVNSYIEALKNFSPLIRCRAAIELGEIGSKKAEDGLIAL